MNAPHDVHALHHTSECGKALAVGIAFAAEIEFGLRADANKEMILGGIGSESGHRHRAVLVFQSRVASPFQGNCGSQLIFFGWIRLRLNDLDLHRHPSVDWRV